MKSEFFEPALRRINPDTVVVVASQPRIFIVLTVTQREQRRRRIDFYQRAPSGTRHPSLKLYFGLAYSSWRLVFSLHPFSPTFHIEIKNKIILGSSENCLHEILKNCSSNHRDNGLPLYHADIFDFLPIFLLDIFWKIVEHLLSHGTFWMKQNGHYNKINNCW